MNNTIVDVLAIGAHPDDIELGCSGTLLRMQSLGYKIGMIDLTRGEKGTRGTAEERKHEAEAGLKVLGFEFRENLDLGDQRVMDTHENRVKVVECIRRHKPKLVMSHYPHDRHPDHEGGGLLVKQAMFLSGAGNFEAKGEIHVPKRLFYWLSHWVFEPNFYVDISEFYQKKLEASRCYTSQFHNPNSTEPPTYISSPEFWDNLEARHRYFGTKIGVKYAEGYLIRDPLKINDPVAFFTS
jgi:bacillithiol biosynthesis deacetylase BshB1